MNMKPQTSPAPFWAICVTLFLAVGLPTIGWGQIGGEEEEPEPELISEKQLNQLLVWMVDDKYEKVLFKAIRYIEDSETSRHPMPYLYMSKAYMGIHNSDDPDLRETYEVDKLKALKNALKYGTKFVKKDKETEYVPSELEYLETLRAETIVAAETEMDNKKYTKAKSYYKSLRTLDKEDPGALIMLGTTYVLLRAKRDAELVWEEARNILLDREGRGLTASQSKLLKYAIIASIELMDEAGERDMALSWVSVGNDLLSGDRQFEAVKRSIGA